MIHDKRKPFMVDGKKRYEQAKVDGDLVNADNVHKFIIPRTAFDGIASMDCICLSSMGISVPVKLKVVVGEQPELRREVGMDDLYGDEEETAPPTTAAPTSTVVGDDMTAMLASLSNE
jgi:hypothetical protein